MYNRSKDKGTCKKKNILEQMVKYNVYVIDIKMQLIHMELLAEKAET